MSVGFSISSLINSLNILQPMNVIAATVKLTYFLLEVQSTRTSMSHYLLHVFFHWVHHSFTFQMYVSTWRVCVCISGLLYEGIYRISGVKSKVQMLRDAYNRRQPAHLYEHDPSIVASLLKQFLRELPEPVLTNQLMQRFEQASGMLMRWDTAQLEAPSTMLS